MGSVHPLFISSCSSHVPPFLLGDPFLPTESIEPLAGSKGNLLVGRHNLFKSKVYPKYDLEDYFVIQIK
jgi:hypothetical protein